MSPDEEPSTSASVRRKKYLQYYRKEWEEEFPGWLQDSRKGESYAYCKSCNKDINITSGKDAIKKHSSSQAHSVSSKNIKSQPKISSFTVTKTQKSDILVKQGNFFSYLFYYLHCYIILFSTYRFIEAVDIIIP